MRPHRTISIAAATLTIAHLLWVATGAGAGTTAHAVTRLAAIATGIFTTLACISAARRNREAARRGWTLMALTAMCWLVANVVDGWLELRGDYLPVPSASDAPSSLALVFAATAMLTFLTPALSSAARMRTLLDGLMIASALAFVGWATILREVYQAAGQGPELVAALFIPAGDLVIMALVLVATTRVRAGSRLPWALLGTGLVLITAGDTVLAYLQLAAVLSPAAITYCSWIGGCTLVGVAALVPTSDATPISQDPRLGRPSQIVVPYIPVIVAGVIALQSLRAKTLDGFLIGNGAVLLVLLLARQLLAQLENLELARALDTRVQQRTAEIMEQRAQFHALVQNATDVVTVLDGTGVVRYQSASAERVLGFRFSELVGTRFSDLLHPDDRADMLARVAAATPPPARPVVIEGRFKRKDGTWVITETTVSDLRRDDNVRGLLLTTRDISDRRAMLDELRHRALHDPLTGLGNRILFRDRLDHTIARAARSPQPVAVLMVDLDGFKGVNDSLGHAAGDHLLREIGQRLRASVRPGDTIARMGGDEFAVLIEGGPPETAATVAHRILNRLRAPIELEGKPVVCQASIGMSSGTTASGADELLRHADIAMYTVKQSGKGRLAAFDPTMLSAAVERVELESDLRRAVRERKLEVHYQPIVRLPHGKMTGAEALVRWNHPVRGPLPPSDFIALAEESDLVVELGRLVLNEACRQAVRFQETAGKDFVVSVNVAARQLASPWLVKEVREALEATGLAAECLVLEITEGALMTDPLTVVPALEALKQLGVQLAIDDFGTGWSSLSRLRSFPVDKLKIDKAFVQEIEDAADSAPIATAVIAMAHSLSLTTVAEGVETVEQLAFLHQHGCEEVQGYLLGRPMTADQLVAVLSSPAGLLADAIDGAEMNDEDRGLAEAVTAAMTPDAEDVMRPALAELQRASGLDAVFLTEVDFDAGTQTVRAVWRTEGGPPIADGLAMEWDGSPACRMLSGGAATVRDLSSSYPASELVRYGAATHICVPVSTPDDKVFGMLCGVSSTPQELATGMVTLFDLFARLLIEHVGAGLQRSALIGTHSTLL